MSGSRLASFMSRRARSVLPTSRSLMREPRWLASMNHRSHIDVGLHPRPIRPTSAGLTTSVNETKRLLLVEPERANVLATLSNAGSPFGWQEDSTGRNAITKTFQFVDFVQAWQWMNQVATLAETMQHHPEWSNVYNTVHVTLTTHDCGGVSSLDIAMATQMDAMANEILPSTGSNTN